MTDRQILAEPTRRLDGSPDTCHSTALRAEIPRGRRRTALGRDDLFAVGAESCQSTQRGLAGPLTTASPSWCSSPQRSSSVSTSARWMRCWEG